MQTGWRLSAQFLLKCFNENPHGFDIAFYHFLSLLETRLQSMLGGPLSLFADIHFVSCNVLISIWLTTLNLNIYTQQRQLKLNINFHTPYPVLL